MTHDASHFLIAVVNGFNAVCPGQTIQEDGTQQNSLKVGTHLLTQLAKLRDQYEIIGDVRGKGLQIGVEMVKDKVAGVCVFFLVGEEGGGAFAPHMLGQRAEPSGGSPGVTVQPCPS